MNTLENIPVFILAGGLGTRLSEETQLKPKPMVEIGDIPILVHLMRSYYREGFNDFVICGGYRSWEIKKYFLDYEFRVNNLAIDHRASANHIASSYGRNLTQEKWRIRVIDTGVECMTGARLARAFDIAYEEEKFSDFALTYGDGLSDVDLKDELEFHRSHQRVGTVMGVPFRNRFGVLEIEKESIVSGFLEKPDELQQLISAGFFFFKSVFRKYLDSDASSVLEQQPLERLAREQQLRLYRHSGFWYPMDTLRDKMHLEELWKSGEAPWLKDHRKSERVGTHPKSPFLMEKNNHSEISK